LVLQQNRLRWCWHVLRKEDNDWVKKCMEYELEGARPKGRPEKTWREIVEKDCRACGLKPRMPWIVVDGESRLGWLMTTMSVSGWMFLLVPAHQGCPGQIPQSRKTVVLCVVCVDYSLTMHFWSLFVAYTDHQTRSTSCVARSLRVPKTSALDSTKLKELTELTSTCQGIQTQLQNISSITRMQTVCAIYTVSQKSIPPNH